MSINVEILEQSFAIVRPKMAEFSASFYETLLADYPAIRPLFSNTNMVMQQRKLADSLELVIENLRNPDILTGALRGLGHKHVKYGVLPEHYPLVGGSLLKTFEAYLDNDWTAEVKQAWTDAYGAIASLMLEGAVVSEEVLKLKV
jgi:hemoglobin-like flavoprotein